MTLRSVASNVGWLLSDNVGKLIFGLVTTAAVARSIGPQLYGELAYVTALVALVGVACKLGLDTVVVRDVSADSTRAAEILGTVFRMRIASGIAGWFGLLGLVAVLRPGDWRTMTLAAIAGISLVFQASDTFDYWFQSRIKSKRTVLSRAASYLIVTIFRICLALYRAPLVAFAAVFAAESIITFWLMRRVYRWEEPIGRWKWSTRDAKRLLIDSWPFLVGGLATIVYVRIDQIMLRELVGVKELGYYSVALSISLASYALPSAVMMSLAPLITGFEKSTVSKDELLLVLFGLMWWVSLPLSVLVSLTAPWGIRLLFGDEYAPTGRIISIHIFSNIPVALGVAQTYWSVHDRKGSTVVYRAIVGAIASVVLNYVLIPYYGGIGAAIAAVCAMTIADVVTNSVIDPVVFRLQILGVFRFPSAGLLRDVIFREPKPFNEGAVLP